MRYCQAKNKTYGIIIISGPENKTQQIIIIFWDMCRTQIIPFIFQNKIKIYKLEK